MKKTYVKPMIQFENFQLSSSIAVSCKFDPEFGDKNSCPVTIDKNMTIFITEGVCSFTTQDEDVYGVCYHVPTEDNNVFNS